MEPKNKLIKTENRLVSARGGGPSKLAEMSKGSQKVQTVSYKTGKSWGKHI